MIREKDFVEALGLKRIYDAKLKYLNIEVSNSTRPGLQLADYWDFFAFERPQLLGLVDKMRANNDRGVIFAQEDQSFHITLLAHVRNPLIRELNDAFWRIQSESQPLLNLPMPEDINQTIEAHREIVEALSAGDGAAYRRAVTAHYAPFRRMIGEKLGAAD